MLNKISITLLMVIQFSCTAFANEPCSNLSHISKLGAGDVHVKQIGCEKFERETFFDGKPMGDINYILISDKWDTTNINDEYETVTNNQRWIWSLDKTKIIHEFSVDSVSKSNGSREFMSGSDVFEVSNGVIKKSSALIQRKESVDGKITVESKNTSLELPRLISN